jgi:hypothetical protein
LHRATLLQVRHHTGTRRDPHLLHRAALQRNALLHLLVALRFIDLQHHARLHGDHDPGLHWHAELQQLQLLVRQQLLCVLLPGAHRLHVECHGLHLHGHRHSVRLVPEHDRMCHPEWLLLVHFEQHLQRHGDPLRLALGRAVHQQLRLHARHYVVLPAARPAPELRPRRRRVGPVSSIGQSPRKNRCDLVRRHVDVGPDLRSIHERMANPIG